VPPDFIRKQTLVNGERFFTPELKEYESLILNARDRIAVMETDPFPPGVPAGAAESEKVLSLAAVLSHLDVFSSLAEVAVHHGYVRPELDGGNIIDIRQGRHPLSKGNSPP
jgi:DNA mismatch repair protein MutS